MEMKIEINGYEFRTIEERILREFTAELRKKIDFNLLQKQIRNQLVKEIKPAIQKEVRELIYIESIAKSVEDVAMNHAMNIINERLKDISIKI